MFGNIKIISIAAAVVVVAFGSAYFFGKSAGKEVGRQEALRASVQNLRERSITNEKINGLDRAGLCVELGGLPGECASF